MKLKNHPGFKRLAVVITLASFVITYFYYFVDAGSNFESRLNSKHSPSIFIVKRPFCLFLLDVLPFNYSPFSLVL